MRLKHKIILTFSGMAMLAGIVPVVCIRIGQELLGDSMGGSSAALARETMDVLERLTNIALSATAALIILCTLLGIIIFNHTWRPLLKLKAAMNKIADGKLDFRIDVHRKDEIGELADTFNHMVEQRQQVERCWV